MVRENPESEGVDANKNVDLEETLRDAGKWQGDSADPEDTMTTTMVNTRDIRIRGDAVPDKEG